MSFVDVGSGDARELGDLGPSHPVLAVASASVLLQCQRFALGPAEERREWFARLAALVSSPAWACFRRYRWERPGINWAWRRSRGPLARSQPACAESICSEVLSTDRTDALLTEVRDGR